MLALLVVGVGSCGAMCSSDDELAGGGDPDDSAGRASSTTAVPTSRPPSTTAPTTTVPPTTPAPTVAPTTRAPSTTVQPALPPGATVATVTGIVDGDTIDVSGGQRVRLIGIDTPEVGECGFGAAASELRRLVGGRSIVLVPGARDDRDRYGRLLRYVEVDGIDANLALIRAGLAIARYDSRDGYGRHAREAEYVSVDRDSPSRNGCPDRTPTTVASGPAAPGGAGLDPRFPSCAAAKRAGYGPYVAGVDPEYDWYRDGDGDGVNCE